MLPILTRRDKGMANATKRGWVRGEREGGAPVLPRTRRESRQHQQMGRSRNRGLATVFKVSKVINRIDHPLLFLLLLFQMIDFQNMARWNLYFLMDQKRFKVSVKLESIHHLLLSLYPGLSPPPLHHSPTDLLYDCQVTCDCKAGQQ